MPICKECGDLITTGTVVRGCCEQCSSKPEVQDKLDNAQKVNSDTYKPLSTSEKIISILIVLFFGFMGLLFVWLLIEEGIDFDMDFFSATILLLTPALYVFSVSSFHKTKDLDALKTKNLLFGIILLFALFIVATLPMVKINVVIAILFYVLIVYLSILYIYKRYELHYEWIKKNGLFSKTEKKKKIIDYNMDVPSQLAKYFKLFNDGAITEEEYEKVKNELLDNPTGC